MKNLILSLLLVGLLAKSDVINLHLNEIGSSFNPNEVERGYISGSVNRAVDRGVIWKAFEGSLLMGTRTTEGPLYDIECIIDTRRKNSGDFKPCQIARNPWTFSSFHTSEVNEFQKFSGPVLLRYSTYYFVPVLESDNIVHNAYSVDPSIPLPIQKLEVQGIVPKYGEGYINGTVIRAALEGVIRRQYEVIIQGQNGTDEFYAMNLRSRQLFNFIVMTMLTGRVIKLHYQQMYAPQADIGRLIGYGTRFLVIGAEAL